MSGEVMQEVAEPYRDARKEVEGRLNKCLEARNFGDSVETVSFVAILRPDGDTKYPEVRKYHRRTRDVELRISIDFDRFLKAGREDQAGMVAEAFLRGVSALQDLGIDNLDCAEVVSACRSCLA